MSAINKSENGLAVGGYDVVAYFKINTAVEGSSDHQITHGDAIYRFSSAANREAFQSEPEKYVPAFGGYCPFGVVAMKQLAPTDPQTFRIQDDKLLLFFNDMWEGEMFDTSKKWDEDPNGFMEKARAGWPALANS